MWAGAIQKKKFPLQTGTTVAVSFDIGNRPYRWHGFWARADRLPFAAGSRFHLRLCPAAPRILPPAGVVRMKRIGGERGLAGPSVLQLAAGRKPGQLTWGAIFLDTETGLERSGALAFGASTHAATKRLGPQAWRPGGGDKDDLGFSRRDRTWERRMGKKEIKTEDGLRGEMSCAHQSSTECGRTPRAATVKRTSGVGGGGSCSVPSRRLGKPEWDHAIRRHSHSCRPPLLVPFVSVLVHGVLAESGSWR